MSPFAIIEIGIDPEIHLGPVTLAWHGLTIAIGIVLGAIFAGRWARARGLDPDLLTTLGSLAALGGIVGGRLFYVLENGGPLLGTRGFTFNGGFIGAGLLIALYVRRKRLDGRYLDAAALGLPLGVAVGRIGDIINGEHYGSQSTSLLAVRNSHPDALTPNPALAFQNGGLLEVLLALVVLAVMVLARNRVTATGDLVWLVIGLFADGRFFEFFLRDDSPQLALGLDNAQWTSVLLLVVAVAGRFVTHRLRGPTSPTTQPGATPAR